jgi:hypothetical protein
MPRRISKRVKRGERLFPIMRKDQCGQRIIGDFADELRRAFPPFGARNPFLNPVAQHLVPLVFHGEIDDQRCAAMKNVFRPSSTTNPLRSAKFLSTLLTDFASIRMYKTT